MFCSLGFLLLYGVFISFTSVFMRLVFSVVFPGTRFSARVLQIVGHFETTGQNSSIKDLFCSYVLFILY